MGALPSDDAGVPNDYVPSDILYLLDEWRPEELHILEKTWNESGAVPPRSATANTISKTPLRRSTRKVTKVNTNTRPAAFYDKHFADHLVLKHVKLLGTLVNSLAGTVDTAIKEAYKSGPLPPVSGMLIKNEIKDLTGFSPTFLEGEDGVLEHYKDLTAFLCLPVASTLALHPTLHRWISRLRWTREQHTVGYAIADGALRLLPAPHSSNTHGMTQYRDAVAHTYPDVREILSELEIRYPVLAVWEMKSLTVGDAAVMGSIVEMARNGENFQWKICRGGCNDPGHTNICKTREQLPHGVDALQPPWTLPSDPGGGPDELPSFRHGHRPGLRQVSSSAAPSYSGQSLQLDSSLSSLTSDDGDDLIDRSKRKRGNGKGKQRARSNDSYMDEGGSRANVNKKSFLQQAWAEAVRVGSTILVLHSGNHEIIGIRHRKTQTLYTSDIILPHSSVPSYGKIQVGIYIAAIRDAIDRVRQDIKADQEKAESAKSAPSKGNRDKGPHQDKDESDDSEGPSGKRRKGDPATKGTKKNKGRTSTSRRGRPKSGRTAAGKSTVSADQLAREEINTVFMHFCYGIYASPCAATFIRKVHHSESPLPTLTPPPSPEPGRPKLSMDITLTSEMRPGFSGIVHIGKMEVDCSGGPVDVAVKLAFSEEEKATLKHEHRIYSHLHSKGVSGIPQNYGLFEDEDDELLDDEDGRYEGPYALILSFAGVSLWRQGSDSPFSVKISLLTTLKAMHQANVVHGDIRLQNLCCTDSGEAFVIDFSHSQRTTNEATKASEIKELCNLLKIENVADHVNPVSEDETPPFIPRRSTRLQEKYARLAS